MPRTRDPRDQGDWPFWAAQLAGEPLGEEWRFDDEQYPSEPDTPWGLLWNPELGEIVAIQILDGRTGRVLLLGTVPPAERCPAVSAWLQAMAEQHMGKPESLMTLAWAIDEKPWRNR